MNKFIAFFVALLLSVKAQNNTKEHYRLKTKNDRKRLYPYHLKMN